MDFSKCRNLVIRGYNKAGLYNTVSAGIKDCAQFNPILIVPNIIVDTVGPADPADGNAFLQTHTHTHTCTHARTHSIHIHENQTIENL